MTFPAGETPGSAEQSDAKKGVIAEASRLFGSFSRHFHAFASLLGVEAKEAVVQYLRAAIALGVGLVFVAFGYIFVLLTIAFAFAKFAGVDWLWIALGFALFHLVVAGISLLYMKSNFSKPVFRATSEEIKRDIEAVRGSRNP